MTISVLACREAVGCDLPLEMPSNVVLVDDLCSHPGAVAELAAGSEGLVLLVHPREVEPSRLQAAIRRAGLDPFGVPLIDVGAAAGDSGRLSVLIDGAVARTAAFPGSHPEQTRPVRAEKISRRSLLTVPRHHYEAVPAIDRALCAAGDGCTACVDLCPPSAYRVAGRRVALNKDACIGCGLCVTGCPAGAIEHPSVSGTAIRAEITAIVNAGSPVGIVFVCSASKVPVDTPNWYGVSVPCAAMVPGTWPIAAVLLGAAAATIRSCSDGGCPVGLDETVAEARSFGREISVAAGLGAASVPDRPGLLPDRVMAEPCELDDPFGVHGAAEVALTLVAVDSSVSLRVEAPASPLGVVEIDQAACTVCTMCAEACPSGALGHEYTDGIVALSFDAAVCTACAQCLPVCPESERGAISLSRRTDTAAVSAGRVIVNRTPTVACESCGGPIAPAAALDRIAGLLGEEHAETARYLARRCMDCRGLS